MEEEPNKKFRDKCANDVAKNSCVTGTKMIISSLSSILDKDGKLVRLKKLRQQLGSMVQGKLETKDDFVKYVTSVTEICVSEKTTTQDSYDEDLEFTDNYNIFETLDKLISKIRHEPEHESFIDVYKLNKALTKFTTKLQEEDKETEHIYSKENLIRKQEVQYNSAGLLPKQEVLYTLLRNHVLPKLGKGKRPDSM